MAALDVPFGKVISMNPIIAGMGILSAAIMAGALYYLSSLRNAVAGLHKWAVGILFLGGHEVLQSLLFAEQTRVSLVLGQSLHLSGAVLLLAGAQAFNGKAASRLLVSVVVVSVAGLFASALMVSDRIAPASAFLHLVGGGIVILAGLDMMRSRTEPRDSILFVGTVLSGWGVTTMALGLLLSQALDHQWGILVDLVFGELAALGLIVLAMRRQRLDLEDARDRAHQSGVKAAEQAGHIRRILDGLPEAVIVIDAQGRICDFNPSAERIFGFEESQVIGRDAGVLLPVKGGREAGGLIAHLARKGQDRTPRTEPLYGLHRDGSRVAIDLAVSQAEQAGEVLSIGLIRDVTKALMGSRLTDFLHGLDRKVLHGRSPQELDRDICEETCTTFDLPFCALVSWDGSGLALEAVAGINDPDAVGQAIRDLTGRTDLSAPLVEAAAQASVKVITGPSAARLVRMLPGSYEWVVVMPVIQQAKVASLLIAAGRGERPEEETLEQLETLGARIGAARQSVHDQVQLRLQGTAMAAAANAIFITDNNGRIEWVNDAFTRLSGYSRPEAIGQLPSLLRSGAQDEDVYQRLWETIRRGEVWRGEMVERRKDGSLYTVDQTVAPITDDTGHIAHYVVVHEDVTERKRAEERILYLSNYDSLTRLPNRVLFRDHLYQAVSHARQTRGALAVLFIDLDRFSRVNDTLGHEVGDQLLMTVASRINAVAAPYADTIARIGGDEFAIIQSRLSNADAAGALARRVVDAVNQPTDLDGIEVRVGANIGIAIFPQDGEDPDHLIKNADMAMYRAIRSEAEATFFFSNEMNDEARIRLGLEGDLRKALSQGDLSLFYQPQIDVTTRRVIGCEALLRWNHPEQGPISPVRFIPVAEDSGLILPIGEWVLEQALAQSRAWQDADLPGITMAVNISAVQFRQQGLVKHIRRTMDACGVDPGRLELELTESMLMQDAHEAVQVLTTLSDLGAQLAIDDFGTGYSSLSYLKQFPVDKLKLDQSFVRHMVNDHNDAVIARATINLGHSLGLEVIAEGVETEEQFSYLRAEGCDVVQGFLFGRPMPADDLAALLRTQGAQANAETGEGI